MLSCDEQDINDEDQGDINLPTEALNQQKPKGLPYHCLQIKLGVPLMIIRNLCPIRGIANGTRVVPTKISKYMIIVTIISGKNKE